MQLRLEDNHLQWEQKTFDSGHLIVPDVNILWLIKQGVVKTRTWDEEGNAIILGYWGQDDLVGHALSRVEPYEIECLTQVAATCIPCQDWHYVSHKIVGHYQDTEELLCIYRQKNLYKRTMRILIYLVQKFGIELEKGQLIQLSLTHQELAEFIWSSRVCVTRIINRLEQEKLIVRPTRGSIILSPELIAKLAPIPNIII